MKMNLKIGLFFSVFTLFGFLPLQSQDQNNFEISKNIEIYVDVLRQLNLNYADNIQPGDLNKTAIDAMLGKLDPYTVYVPESQIEDFELMTRGEYGGIGALIQKQGDYVVVSEPYEGFPAQKSGLKAGDKIIKVDGESAVGKNTSDVSEKLKGAPGTEIVITIERYGDTIQQDVVLVREKVKIPNIPYYGMLDETIGYVHLSQFNPNSASEVKKAFEELKSKNDMKGFVLDLRGNGGGLLNEAVDIVNIFVPKGTLVVTTKGKLSSNTQVHKTRNSAVDTKIPLAVLVDENSASASEIVAGAIQDLDRGVILGERTFGKGLVQNVVPLPYNSKIKITVAKYYIPSGRCIQAIDYFEGSNNGRSDKIPDSLISAFKTQAGRTVYDGGGIEPDVKLKAREYNQITGDLYAQNYIFNFTNDFVLKNDSISSPEEFVINEEIFDEFKLWVSNQEFDYLTETENLVERMKGSAEREGYLEAIQPLLDQLEVSIKEEKTNDIDRCREEIAEFLKLEIITRYYYQKGRLIVALQTDPDTEEAVKVLTDPAIYKSILDGTYENENTQSAN
jgi:carboxyl-terminal processing protease